MSQENINKESPKTMLQELVREEIRKAPKSRQPLLAIGLSVLALFGLAASLIMSAENPASTPETKSATVAKLEAAYPLEKIVGITTALMVMADNKKTLPELELAMDIIARRQETLLGVPPQFKPSPESKWLNRNMTMTYFNAALAYLNSATEINLKTLNGNAVGELITNKSFALSEEESLKSVYVLIALLQGAMDEKPEMQALGKEIKSLISIWSTRQHPGLAQNADAADSFYAIQSDRIIRNLNNPE